MAGHQATVDLHRPVASDHDAGDSCQDRRVDRLPKRQNHGVGGQLFQLPRGLGSAIRAAGHPLDHDPVGTGETSDLAQPAHGHALIERFHHLALMGRHFRPGASVEDDRVFCAEAFRRARGIERGVAPADDDHGATELQRPLA